MSVHELRLESDRRQVRFAVALTLFPIVWFIRTDFALFGDDWSQLLPRFALRAAAAIGVVASILLLSRHRSPEAYSRIVLGISATVAVFMLAISVTRPQGATMTLRTPLFLLFLLYAAFPNTYWRQCLPPLAMSAGLVILRLTWLTSPLNSDVAGDVVILVLSNLLGLLMVRHRTALERQLTDAWNAERAERAARRRAVEELKELREVIPICMHCKSVRSEIGQWHRIEAYVKTHIEAEFSHGICPGCLAEHYGGFNEPTQTS